MSAPTDSKPELERIAHLARAAAATLWSNGAETSTEVRGVVEILEVIEEIAENAIDPPKVGEV